MNRPETRNQLSVCEFAWLTVLFAGAVNHELQKIEWFVGLLSLSL
jgi:hypothetical protein